MKIGISTLSIGRNEERKGERKIERERYTFPPDTRKREGTRTKGEKVKDGLNAREKDNEKMRMKD